MLGVPIMGLASKCTLYFALQSRLQFKLGPNKRAAPNETTANVYCNIHVYILTPLIVTLFCP